jgi:uncharacterized membrane protein YgcG
MTVFGAAVPFATASSVNEMWRSPPTQAVICATLPLASPSMEEQVENRGGEWRRRGGSPCGSESGGGKSGGGACVLGDEGGRWRIGSGVARF